MSYLTQSERLLAYLKGHKEGILNIDMQREVGILCYTKRISDLRKDGHNIRTQRLRAMDGKYRGTNRYYLEPEIKSPNVLHKIFKRRAANGIH